MRRLRLLVFLAAGLTLAVSPAAAQPALAKLHLAAAKAHAKTWHADAYLFQIQAYNVTDGTAVWEYDFTAPSAGGKCLMVGVPKGTPLTGPIASCDTKNEMMIGDFLIDSDKAVTIARAAGLAKPKLSLLLSKSGMGSTERLIWLVMEDRGMNSGDWMVDIDAMTGAVTHKTRQP